MNCQIFDSEVGIFDFGWRLPVAYANRCFLQLICEIQQSCILLQTERIPFCIKTTGGNNDNHIRFRWRPAGLEPPVLISPGIWEWRRNGNFPHPYRMGTMESSARQRPVAGRRDRNSSTPIPGIPFRDPAVLWTMGQDAQGRDSRKCCTFAGIEAEV